MTLRLRSKVAKVAGSASGIGQASALTLLREAARVVIADVNGARAAETRFCTGMRILVDGGLLARDLCTVSSPAHVSDIRLQQRNGAALKARAPSHGCAERRWPTPPPSEPQFSTCSNRSMLPTLLKSPSGLPPQVSNDSGATGNSRGSRGSISGNSSIPKLYSTVMPSGSRK